MGRKATNMLAFNDQALRKVIKGAKDRKEGEDRKKKEDRKEQAQREYRIEGLSRLALVVQPTGTATFFVFYTAPDGKRQKLKLGQYHPDNYTLREARGAATDALALINRGADPVAEAEAKAKSLTFKQLAEQFLTEASHLATTTRRNYRQYLEKDVYPVIGAKPASDLTGDHIVGICKTIEATGASVQSQS